ncbi:MAG: DUF58 domain-containing protein [Proteobacteria bacterium]|nr:DUF58 domain-containing protein [Pseudomonadota bacterium]
MKTLRDFVKKLKKIEFHMRTRTHEAIAGSYHSAFKGRGMSFSECKAYEEGDDVRYINWHASARQQGVFVKRFVEERELSVWIVLDLSQSMQFGSVGVTKAEAAIEAMAVMAFSALYNNDRVGLLIFDGRGSKIVPQLKGKRQIFRFIVEALQYAPRGEACQLSQALMQVGQLAKRRSLVFVIGDFVRPCYETELKRLAFRHEVIPVVVSDPLEYDLPDLGMCIFEDPESHRVLLCDTSRGAVRSQIAQRFEARRAQQGVIFKRARIAPVCLSTTSDVLRPLSLAFDVRSRHV